MIFTEKNIYILSKLVALMRRENGSKHRLNTEQAIFELLLEASMQPSERIQSYYHRFLDNLSAEQLNKFKKSGLNIPDTHMKKASLFPQAPVRQYAYVPRH